MAERITLKTAPDEEFIMPGRSGCAGCAAMLAVRMATKIMGPNTIMVNATGCVISNFTHAGAPCIPFIHSLLPATGAMLSGIDAGLKAKSQRDGVNLLGLAGDGGTVDIGLQSLSGAVERGHRFVYVCYDNEGYMNTGGQRSGSTPGHARTSTTPVGTDRDGEQRLWKRRKDMVRIMAAHGIPYVATASVAHNIDLMRKLRRAVETDGPTYLHILTPCNYRWGFPESQSIEVARLAVETRFAPLYEVEDGTRVTLQYRTKPPKPVAEYLSVQGRFHHLFADDRPHSGVDIIQREVDENWARLERWAAQSTC